MELKVDENLFIYFAKKRLNEQKMPILFVCP
jgi:hypothetical protein